MGPWFDAGQEARGVVAIGQVATGVIAIGQVATGVIAIGQGARGIVAIGMGAVGVISIGMMSVGLLYNASMMGIGGMGIGLVIRLLPFRRHKLDVPDDRPWSRLENRINGEGWIKAALTLEGRFPALTRHGKVLPIRIQNDLVNAAEDAAKGGETVLAHLRNDRQAGWVCDRLMEIPSTTEKVGGFAIKWIAGIAVLGIAALGWWIFAGAPLLYQLWGPGGLLVP